MANKPDMTEWLSARQWALENGYGNGTISFYLKYGAFDDADLLTVGRRTLIRKDARINRKRYLENSREARRQRGIKYGYSKEGRSLIAQAREAQK